MSDTGVDFSQLASRYQREAVVQQRAADRLFELLRIKDTDDVFDLGCGSGAMTRRIRGLTRGRVVGVDPALGMIGEARGIDSEDGPIEYGVMRAQDIGAYISANTGRSRAKIRPAAALSVATHTSPANARLVTSGAVSGLMEPGAGGFALDLEPHSFDVVFCNSVLHWIKPLAPALAGVKMLLKKGGKFGVQAAAMSEYCPNFARALERVRTDLRTRDGYKDFVAPWSFLESEAAYALAFAKAGLDVPYVALEDITSRHTVEEAFGVFSAGAAAGYLNQDNYRSPFDTEYYKAFLSVIHEALESQRAADGLIDLIFRRVYIVSFA